MFYVKERMSRVTLAFSHQKLIYKTFRPNCKYICSPSHDYKSHYEIKSIHPREWLYDAR